MTFDKFNYCVSFYLTRLFSPIHSIQIKIILYVYIRKKIIIKTIIIFNNMNLLLNKNILCITHRRKGNKCHFLFQIHLGVNPSSLSLKKGEKNICVLIFIFVVL